MTNRARDPGRAEVVRALSEMTNGHGLPANGESVSPGGIVLPKMEQVRATAEGIAAVADAVAACALLGRAVTLRVDPATGARLEAKVPHFGAMLAVAKEEWKEPDAVQAAKLALVEEVARHQAAIYELGPAVARAQQEVARKKIAEAQAGDEKLPEAPAEGSTRRPEVEP